MRVPPRAWAAATAFVVLSTVALSAQHSAPVARPTGRTGSAPVTGRPAAVFGYVWKANNEPVANAEVRLRNVVTGRVEAHAVASDVGEFTFQNLDGGSYVVEYTDRSGNVLAVGHIFSIAAGETVVTFIRLGSRQPWFAALFGSAANTAATVIASAASLGLTAIAPASRDVTPNQ